MTPEELELIYAEWDRDDTQRWEHLAAADPEDGGV